MKTLCHAVNDKVTNSGTWMMKAWNTECIFKQPRFKLCSAIGTLRDRTTIQINPSSVNADITVSFSTFSIGIASGQRLKWATMNLPEEVRDITDVWAGKWTMICSCKWTSCSDCASVYLSLWTENARAIQLMGIFHHSLPGESFSDQLRSDLDTGVS